MAISREDRARQFLPFAALEGFEEAVRKKEIEFDEKKELSEEMEENISKTLNKIETGSIIKVNYYKFRKYVDEIAEVKKIEKYKEKIILTNGNEIFFDDIFSIELV